MGRHVLAGLLVVAETILLMGVHEGDPPPWAAVGHPAAVIAIIALRRRAPITAFAAALGLGVLTGAGLVLLVWISYQTGRSVLSRRGTAAVAAVALGSLALRPGGAHPLHVIVFCLVFLALPLLVGRYVAQHERLVAALEAGNRRLRRERELLAEQERLRERLRIARDMHDSLGHRLGLVAIQAAALEVSPLPPEQATAIRRLAASARDAVDELHELVGALRTADDEPSGRGVAEIVDLVGEYRTAGVPVTLRRRGEPRPLPAAADPVAYRVVEEGLTNAARHAPGLPVTVTLEWEPDALLIEVVNPLPAVPAGTRGPEHGDGVLGLERGHGVRGLEHGHGALGLEREHGAPGPVHGHGAPGPVHGDGVRGLERGHGALGLERGHGALGLERGHGALGLERGHGVLGLERGHGAPGPVHGDGVRGLEHGHGALGLERGHGVRGLEHGHGALRLERGHGVRGPERGHGLRGLRERVAPIGGLLDHRRSGDSFRLFAMLPLDAAPAPAALAGAPLRRPEPALASQIHDGMPAAQPGGDLPDGADPSYDPLAAYRPAILRRDLSVGLVGAAIAFLIFVLLPASTMVGIGG